MKKFRTLAGVVFIGSALSMGTAQATCSPDNTNAEKPANLIALDSVAPNVIQKIRYASDDNFLGRPVKGYNAPRCYLSEPAAQALADIQTQLEEEGLGLMVFDCYRPQQAVNDFMVWAAGSGARTKTTYYPNVAQTDLIPQGYIAECSGHSRGSTVDITLVKAGTSGDDKRGCNGSGSGELDMGTGHDCFDPRSETTNPAIDIRAKRRRMKLAGIMERHGFKNYAKEWWHFTLKDEPYPDTYFDFPVE